MIPTKIHVGEAAYDHIKKHIVDLLNQQNTYTDTKDRYRRVYSLWSTLEWPYTTVNLRDYSDSDLWDLWGVIPVDYVKLRRELARYLERSPLIKLAECAD